MKITFKIILIITIIFFSKESLDGGLCESNTDCDPNEKEGECKDIKDGFDIAHVWKDIKEEEIIINV